jgi:hypothetical protein
LPQRQHFAILTRKIIPKKENINSA